MNWISRFGVLAAFLLSGFTYLAAQSEEEGETGSSFYMAVIKSPYDEEEALEIGEELLRSFKNLSEKESEKFIELLSEANRFLNQKRIIESLAKVYEAGQIYDQYPMLYNIKGSCYSELRDFKSATRAFEKALKLNPYHKGVRFNLAEMEFVTHDWKDTELAFEKLIPLMKEEGKQTLLPVIEFKLLISKLKLGKLEEAREIAKKYNHLDDTPFHYYANAAFAYEEGDEREAARWQQIASRVFGKTPSFPIWADALVESGYLVSYYGGLVEAKLAK